MDRHPPAPYDLMPASALDDSWLTESAWHTPSNWVIDAPIDAQPRLQWIPSPNVATAPPTRAQLEQMFAVAHVDEPWLRAAPAAAPVAAAPTIEHQVLLRPAGRAEGILGLLTGLVLIGVPIIGAVALGAWKPAPPAAPRAAVPQTTAAATTAWTPAASASPVTGGFAPIGAASTPSGIGATVAPTASNPMASSAPAGSSLHGSASAPAARGPLAGPGAGAGGTTPPNRPTASSGAGSGPSGGGASHAGATSRPAHATARPAATTAPAAQSNPIVQPAAPSVEPAAVQPASPPVQPPAAQPQVAPVEAQPVAETAPS